MNNGYVVFNQKLAGFLMMQGFVLQGIDKSRQPNTTRNVFIFKDSVELRSKINQFSKDS